MPDIKSFHSSFLRLSQVLSIIPVSKSSWYAGIKAQKFPAPVRLGPRTSAWRASDIAELIERLGSQDSAQ